MCLVLISPPVLSAPAEQQMDGALRRGCAQGHPAPRSRPNTCPSPTPRPPGASPPEPHTQQVLSPSDPLAVQIQATGWLLLSASPLGVGSPCRQVSRQTGERAPSPVPSAPVCLSSASPPPGYKGDCLQWGGGVGSAPG